MSNATGLRSQRIRIYERREDGSQGFSRPVYRYAATLWGRLDDRTARQTVNVPPQAHSEYRYGARATFSYRAAIPNDGVLKVTVDGEEQLYFVRGVTYRRALWRAEVDAERIDVETFTDKLVFEDESVADGVHLVSPSAT